MTDYVFLLQLKPIIEFWQQIPPVYGIMAVAILCGLCIRFFLLLLSRFISDKEDVRLLKVVIRHLQKVSYFFFPILMALLLFTWLPPAQQPDIILKKTLEVLFIIASAVMLVKGFLIVEELLFSNYTIEEDENLKERKIVTQLKVLKKFFIVVVVIIAGSIILLNFEGGRKIGAGILTSAGIASIVIGIAAQKTLANLLAGLQIAFTQPIKLDDALIVEGEWGRVEEINLTYVVLRIWDLRRLILPITYFVEKPFQNWTRTSARLVGNVYLYLDYRFPLDELRKYLEEEIDKSEYWDKDVCKIQVTDATDRVMIIRAVMTARNGSDAWDLRCEMREKMIAFIGQKYPEFLPQARIFIESDARYPPLSTESFQPE